MHIFKFLFITVLGLWMTSIKVQANTNQRCISVEGAPGAGKTTFTELLGKHLPNASIVYEPVETYTNVNGTGNALELFFNNQHRWAFTLQSYISLMYDKAITDQAKKSPTSMIVVDGSTYGCCYTFGKMAYRTGTMSPLEWEIYKQLTTRLAESSSTKPCGFIYLQTTPQVALERIRLRDAYLRDKETPSEWEENLDRCYREWFIEKKEIPEALAQIPVLIIDATQNFKDDPVIRQKCIEQVKAFIERFK